MLSLLKLLKKWHLRRLLKDKKYTVAVPYCRDYLVLYWSPTNWKAYKIDRNLSPSSSADYYIVVQGENIYFRSEYSTYYEKITDKEGIKNIKTVYDQFLSELQEIELM